MGQVPPQQPMPDFPLFAELQEATARVVGPAEGTGLRRTKRTKAGGAPEHGNLRPARQGALPVLVDMAENHPSHPWRGGQELEQSPTLLQADSVEEGIADRQGRMVEGHQQRPQASRRIAAVEQGLQPGPLGRLQPTAIAAAAVAIEGQQAPAASGGRRIEPP